MKICYITRAFPKDSFGGGELHTYELWKRAKKIYDTSLISGYKNDKGLLPKNTFAISQKNGNKFLNYLTFYKKSRKYLKEIKPDIIHATCYEFPDRGAKTILNSYHLGHLLGYTGNKNLITKMQLALVKRRLKKFDRIIAISKATYNDLLKLGVREDKLRMVYPGIDFDKFNPGRLKKIKNKKFTIVYPARISREKGQHIAIEAITKIPIELLKDMELVLAGYVSDKEYLNELKRAAFSWPVKFELNVKDIVKYYRLADLIVFPTLMYEGFGFTAAEALACEKPIIASDFPAIREIVGKNGLLIKPGDSNNLASAIEILYDNKVLRDMFAKKGKKDVQRRFNWEKSFKEYCRIYEELAWEKKELS